MLYLHCGWPHTGTSSFQSVMAGCRERLQAEGVIYPDRWIRNTAHHELIELFGPESDTRGIREFQDYLRTVSDQSVLISSEFLTGGLPPLERRGSLRRLLEAATEVTSVRVLWTLRRLDATLAALYISQFGAVGPGANSIVLGPGQWRAVKGYLRWLDKIQGLRELDDEYRPAFTYLRFDENCGHYDELLKVVGVPDQLRAEVIGRMRSGPRINQRMTRKAATALLHLDVLSERTGVELSWRQIHRAWVDGRLRFADDSPFEFVDGGVRRAAHEHALEVCRTDGFDPYIEFFGDSVIEAGEPVSLDARILTDADLEALISVCAQPMPQ